MPLPIDVSSVVESVSPLVESGSLVEVFVEAQADAGDETYHLLATRRAQLEDAETLRRMRAL
jgi:hypothetical protein